MSTTLAKLPNYVLFTICSHLNPPDTVNLMLTCADFSARLDDEMLWRLRRSQIRSKSQHRTASDVALSRDSSLFRNMKTLKRAFLLWWVSQMRKRSIQLSEIYVENYITALRRDLLRCVAELLHTNIAKNTLAGTSAQARCQHSRMLFTLLSSGYHDRKGLETTLKLYSQCSRCTQCGSGGMWVCVCCSEYLCTKCSDGRRVKPGHSLHPFKFLHPPRAGLEFDHTYCCGCFDCGIAVHARCRTKETRSDTRPFLKVRGRTGKQHNELGDALLVEGTLLCPAVNALFKYQCSTKKGQEQLLGNLREGHDFLLTT
jgi:hypothetical protein